MKNFIQLLFLATTLLFLGGCNDDDDVEPSPEAGNLTGGPFTFVVDGAADNVSGISVQGDVAGANSSFIITDPDENILGLPPTIEALEGVNFDEAGPGICLIWYIRYQEDLTGLQMGNNISEVSGNFDLSNSITVNRNELMAGTISGGPFTFIVDGTPDNVSGISLDDSNINGMNTTWVITDDESNILGLPPTIEALEGVDFDGAGAGVCFIWHLTYSSTLTGLEAGNNVSDLEGSFALSSSIEVTRASAGMLQGGPFEFIVDGMIDNVDNISFSDNFDLANSGFVITDDQNNILGLPPTIEALEGVDFDGAGAGVCLIWRITYANELTGLESGENVSDLSGVYSLSNSITVRRASAGMISGGPFDFTVDGTPDFVSGISVSGNLDLDQSTYVVTDDQNNILGLPGTISALEGVNFDNAGAGVCLIWRLTYNDGLTGLMMGENVSGLDGIFDLSNSITVTRN